MYQHAELAPDGTCVRDYIHVSDLAIAHGKACLALSEGHESGCYNLGTNTGYSNRELIEAYRKHVGDLVVLTGPRRDGDPDELVADATKFMDNFNWEPCYSELNTIINSTADWYKKRNVK